MEVLSRWVRRGLASDQATTARRWLRRLGRSYLVMVVLGLVIGLQVAPFAANALTAPASGSVAVIPLEGSIDGRNAASIVNRLEHARKDPQVKAVVLRVNSPGGSAAASETIYLAVARTAAQMPVVAAVDSQSLSGAYYGMVPSDVIYAKPASLIGSVGVIFTAPTPIDPIEGLLTTGPNKLTGADEREWVYKIESVKRAFTGAVVSQRGDRLGLTESELSYAKIYTGSEAVDNGLADRVGGVEDAAAHAADLAGLARYNVKVAGYTGTVTFVTRSAYLASDAPDKELVSPAYLVEPAGTTAVPNLLMLPPSVVRAGLTERPAARAAPAPNATAAGVS